MSSFNVLTKFLIVTAALLTAAAVPGHAESQRVNTISVSGTGTAKVAPDMAIVSVGVLRETKTARAVLDDNNKAMARVLSAMKKQGIAEKDLQTSGFSIQPRYFYPKRKANGEQPAPEITGYVVSNNLDIRVRDLGITGEILDLVVTLGVNSGGNIRFLNDDTTSILEKARIAAVKNAIAKANTLADAAGIALGDILEISENASRPRPVPVAQARSFAVQGLSTQQGQSCLSRCRGSSEHGNVCCGA